MKSKNLEKYVNNIEDFIVDESRHERALAKAMHWEYVEVQKKGSCYDFIAPDGAKIEAKFDWDSIKTGNHYLEFAQTSDDGKTWVPSGFALSAEEADYWVIVNEDWIRTLRIDVLRNWLAEERSTLRITQTRAGVNYNQPGQFSKAYLIPFETIDQLCLSRQRSTIVRKQN
jgi:hypothetical protein